VTLWRFDGGVPAPQSPRECVEGSISFSIRSSRVDGLWSPHRKGWCWRYLYPFQRDPSLTPDPLGFAALACVHRVQQGDPQQPRIPSKRSRRFSSGQWRDGRDRRCGRRRAHSAQDLRKRKPHPILHHLFHPLPPAVLRSELGSSPLATLAHRIPSSHPVPMASRRSSLLPSYSFAVETLGRKLSLFISAIWMDIMFFIIDTLLKSFPPDPEASPPASKVMAVMLYTYVCFYSSGWGPLSWVYSSDIFATRRRCGLAVASASQWLWSTLNMPYSR